MVKKDQIYKWKRVQKYAFLRIKEVISKAPTLNSQLYKGFHIYTFASDTTFAAVLTQKMKDKQVTPIAFMSSGLQGAKLMYLDIDKKAYVVYKVVKHFKPYLLKSHTKVIVPHPSIRSLMVQKEVGDKRGNWITALQEYELEIKTDQIG